MTRFSVVRYGNVAGSRGSVIPVFKRLYAQGVRKLPVTHEEMTRFLITLDAGVEFVLRSLGDMVGGELFVPKLPSVRTVDLVPLIGPDARYEIIGIRAGEKLHEIMIPFEESRLAIDMGDHYILQPSHHWWNMASFNDRVANKGKPVTTPFEYASNSNTWWLNRDELRNVLDSIPAA